MSSTVGSKLTISKKKRENVQSTSNSSLGRQSSRTRKTINPPKRFRVEKVEHCDVIEFPTFFFSLIFLVYEFFIVSLPEN